MQSAGIEGEFIKAADNIRSGRTTTVLEIEIRIKKWSWHIEQMAWIDRGHLDKASRSLSSQTNLLKENLSKAFKHKDATWGSGKL